MRRAEFDIITTKISEVMGQVRRRLAKMVGKPEPEIEVKSCCGACSNWKYGGHGEGICVIGKEEGGILSTLRWWGSECNSFRLAHFRKNIDAE